MVGACSNPLEIDFLESSALTSQNVDTAFFQLISKIYREVKVGYFDDRYEQFNYFGSAKIRQKALARENDDNTLDASIEDGGRSRPNLGRSINGELPSQRGNVPVRLD